MKSEQVFEEFVDTEHVFVLECRNSEQVFGKGAAVSVAFELEYETVFPQLRIVPDPPRRRPSVRVQHRRILLGLVVVGLFLLLALPIRAIGGHAIAGSAPVAGQVYVVQQGDTLNSIAQRVQPHDAAALVQRMAGEVGSSSIVPGEHLLIP
jgi:LysM domain-containing protein